MNTIQIILMIFFAGAAFKAWQRYQSRDITFGMVALWLIFWAAGAWVVVNPNGTFYLARILGVARGADAVMYLALAVLFFMVFRLLVAVERLKKEVTELTRELALKNAEKK
ncbi:MAG: DUF2304 domain-containing protein [Candidatus Magasanikbacteria bacterium]|nr:DUF2304 domain-containing protein [Candidatus Magasanikbacteria bacterium]